jgi:hypothetical protein
VVVVVVVVVVGVEGVRGTVPQGTVPIKRGTVPQGTVPIKRGTVPIGKFHQAKKAPRILPEQLPTKARNNVPIAASQRTKSLAPVVPVVAGEKRKTNRQQVHRLLLRKAATTTTRSTYSTISRKTRRKTISPHQLQQMKEQLPKILSILILSILILSILNDPHLAIEKSLPGMTL